MKSIPELWYRLPRIILVCIFAVGLLSGVVVQPAQAAVHYVLNANDSGSGSLRAAIQSSLPGDTIFFTASLSGATIYLSTELAINKSLTINGAALSSKISISGTNSVRVLNISSGVYLNLYAVDIRNGSAIFGAGIANAGILDLQAVDMHDNSATNVGGALHNSGVLTVTNSTFNDNSAGLYGGGIYNANVATVDRSTLTGNAATYSGGGMYSIATTTTTLSNTTFFNNTASNYGGGAYVFGTYSIDNSTFFENSATNHGGGLYKDASATLVVRNSIIAGSLAGGDCYISGGGSFSVNTNNLIEDGSCSPEISGSPLLGSLSDNGGFTPTNPLSPGSPAIDAGDDGACEATDQRGLDRPQGMHCDIGAYEFASPLVVNSLNDPGNGICDAGECTLREATDYIHRGGTITFAPALSGGTIVLGSKISLEKDMTIDGSSLGSEVSISGGDAVRVFVISADQVVTLDSLFIINGATGASSTYGGGLRTYGDLFVDNCTFQDNYAENNGGAISVEVGGSATIAESVFSNNSAGSGGAIYARYPLTVSYTTFSNNTATNYGGAIEVSFSDHIHPDLEIEASTFTGNDSDSGGAIGAAGDFDVTITGSTFSGNSASSNGGAIDHAGYTLTITDSSFEGNSAASSGGAVYQRGHSMNMTNSLLSANTALDGAGIYYNGDYPGSASVNGSTIQNNIADGNGGGIYSRRGSLTVWDSTISGNSATVGGGILQDSYPVHLHNTTLFGNTAVDGGGFSNTSGPAAYFYLSIYNSTFSDNAASGVGGGLLNYQDIIMRNTIIANSSSGGDCQDLGSFTSNLHNLIEDGSCSPDYMGDPVLGPLADNGGPTKTMALLAGSPAINAGYDGTCEDTDQRGVSRPQGPHCDIGAYEYEYPYSLYLPLILR